jgi:hypothetical protein
MTKPHSLLSKVLHLLLLPQFIQFSSGFQPPKLIPRGCPTTTALRASSDAEGGIIDADFERVVDIYSAGSGTRRKVSKRGTTSTTKKDRQDDDDDEKPMSLLDLSLDADPRWKETRIPFGRGDEYIDGKLAFMVELDGSQYGIAVPFDDAVAVIIQDNKVQGDDKTKMDQAIEYVNPDLYEENEEYQELLEIMAAQVQKEFGEDVTLRKTPKVLTISGDLSSITDKWENNVFGAPVSVEDLVQTLESGDSSEATENELADFLDFMRRELGDEEFEKTMNDEPSNDDKEMMKYFEVPGLSNDPEGLKDLISSMEEDLKENSGVRAKAQEFEINKDDMTLKLISFEFGESGKSYSLVKLLRPYVLVGRLDMDSTIDEGDEPTGIQFELLSSEEENLLIPRLEDVCKEELAAAGLDLTVSKVA